LIDGARLIATGNEARAGDQTAGRDRRAHAVGELTPEEAISLRAGCWPGGHAMNDAELLASGLRRCGGVLLMFMRPIQKDQEQHKKQMRDLRPGDQVITTANFFATVKHQVTEGGQTHLSGAHGRRCRDRAAQRDHAPPQRSEARQPRENTGQKGASA
jgi:hypothetical protein